MTRRAADVLTPVFEFVGRLGVAEVSEILADDVTPIQNVFDTVSAGRSITLIKDRRCGDYPIVGPAMTSADPGKGIGFGSRLVTNGQRRVGLRKDSHGE